VASPGAGRLPSQIEVTLYRIAQEGVTNVIRHAQPTQASVILLRQDHEVSLVVEDDGRGFDLASVEKASTPPSDSSE
jgi:two-component system NarL family sensor kinase